MLLVQRVGDSAPPGPPARTYLVCTNGARDQCCAIRGAAVARALGNARPGAAYESSHLGGHRFAANVLVLPDGLCFGRLDVRAALALVDELDAGRLPLEHFRGRTSLTEEQQAAEIFVRRELALERLDDVAHVEGTTFALADGRVRPSACRACRSSRVRSRAGRTNARPRRPGRWKTCPSVSDTGKRPGRVQARLHERER